MANTLKFKRGLVATIPTAALGEPLFTTDTFDLYIGNGTGNTRFQKYIASGATTQILRGDGSLYTFPLNISSPSNGQVLKYNGTSWVNDSDAGITGSGASPNIAFFTGATTLGSSNNLLWDNANNRLNVNTGGATGSYTVNVRSSVAAILSLKGGASTNQGGALYITNANNSSTLTAFGDSATIAGGTPDLGAMIFTGTSIPLQFYVNGAERMRLFATGNLVLNSTTDNGLRFQVTGDASVNGNTASYIAQLNQANTTAGASFGLIVRGGTNVSDSALRVQNAATTLNLLTVQGNGSLGLGTTLLTGYNVRINKTITGSAVAYGIDIDSAIQSDVTNAAVIYGTSVGTQATTFTLSNLFHYNATQGTFGAGSVVTSQFGFRVSSNMVGATNNYAYYGEIPSGTGRWNLYMNGTANNYMAGSLGIGATADLTFTSLRINKLVSGASTSYSILNGGQIQSTVSVAYYNRTIATTQAATFTLNALVHYAANQSTLGAGSTVTNQYGYIADPTLIGATNNYGFYGEIPSGTGRWNLYMNGTAANYLAGNLQISTDTFFVNTSLNRIGIGTATPEPAFVNGGNAVRSMQIAANGRAGINFRDTSSANQYLNIGVQGTDAWIEAIYSTTPRINYSAAVAHIFYTNSAERMRIFSDGNFGIGTGSTNAGFKLDVNGTMRVSGASTMGGDITMSQNSNAAIGISVTNANNGSSAQARITLKNDINGETSIGKYSTTRTAYKIINSNDSYFYTNQGDISIINDVATGSIKFAAGASSTAHFTIASTGAATFSSSIQAGTAIAIGTTPDTNKPFKILKNINGTVGINFENTSTGSSAFSAIQMGTDVSGGTAFTNLVYSSSGVTAAGVYQPSGTSLINTGSGGLNFLSVSQPIRFFTSTGNGTERVRIKNEGQVHFVPLAAAPTTSVQAGDVYYDSTLAKLRCYDGIQWQDLF